MKPSTTERIPRLTVLTAPIGYGKTTLLEQLTAADLAETVVALSGRSLLPADPEGQRPSPDIAECLRALVDRLATGDPLMVRARQDLYEAVLRLGQPCVIVIDDLDEIPLEVAGRLLEETLVREDSPPALRMIVTTRAALRRPLGDLGKNGQLRQLSSAELAFSRGEIAQVLARQHNHAVDPRVVDELMVASRGWPAGVQLVAHTIDAGPSEGMWIALDDYVATNILSRLDPNARALVLASFDIPFLTPDLWKALTSRIEGSRLKFRDLLSIVPMARLGGALGSEIGYQFIRQVRDSLGRLQGNAASDHVRASVVETATDWLLARGFHHEAVALTRTPGQWERLLHALAPHVRELAIRDQHVDIISLLVQVPHDDLLRSADLAFWYTMSLLSTGEIAEGLMLHNQIMNLPGHSPTPLERGRMGVLDALALIRMGQREPALAAAMDALALLPENAHHERLRAAATAEVLSTHLGNSEQAQEMFELARGIREHLPWDQQWWLSFVLPNQADRMALSGNLTASFDMFRHQFETLSNPLPDQAGLLLMRMALIELERNNILSARVLVDAIAAPLPSTYWMLEVPLTIAKVLHAEGHEGEARESLYAMIRDADRDLNEIDVRRAKVMLAQIWLDAGELELTEAWDDEEPVSIDAWPRSFGNLVPAAVKAQLRIARCEFSDAHRLLDDLIVEGTQREQWGPLVRVYALKALAYARSGELARCHEAIRKALQLGARQGFHRSFLVAGFDTRTLLASPEVTAALASSLDQGHPSRQMAVLSEREREVIRFAALGLTNAGIADRMFISPFTVKNHLARIYEKLNVRNRHQAVVIAVNTGLID